MVNLNTDNLTTEQYSALFTDYALYEHIPTETFLVFQTDSMILAENKDNINLFLDYDYVGAPWHFPSINYTWLKVGNGGLSLRKKSIMLEILNSKVYDGSEAEDTFFSLNLANIQCNIPDYTKAQMFSVESLYYDAPFGIHKCWAFLYCMDFQQLINKYPAIMELIHLQHVV